MPRVGEQSTVSCSVRHTCISAPPTLSLIDIPGTDHLIHTLVSDEIWESKVERTWIVTEENQDVKCTVSYQGGQKATTELKLNVVCEYNLKECSILIRMKMFCLEFKITCISAQVHLKISRWMSGKARQQRVWQNL